MFRDLYDTKSQHKFRIDREISEKKVGVDSAERNLRRIVKIKRGQSDLEHTKV